MKFEIPFNEHKTNLCYEKCSQHLHVKIQVFLLIQKYLTCSLGKSHFLKNVKYIFNGFRSLINAS